MDEGDDNDFDDPISDNENKKGNHIDIKSVLFNKKISRCFSELHPSSVQ